MLTPQQLFDIHGYYDENRYILVEKGYYNFVCPHLEPISINSFAPNEPIKMSRTNNKHVELKEYKFKSGESTFTGKCEVCGKVYYR